MSRFQSNYPLTNHFQYFCSNYPLTIYRGGTDRGPEREVRGSVPAEAGSGGGERRTRHPDRRGEKEVGK